MNNIENVLVTRRYLITGAKRISNYWWAFIVSFGGLAFFMTGFASFLQKGIFLFNQSKTISFFPQGLIMCFYGCLGLLFGFYLWCTILWKVGDGFNEFNQTQGFVRIFRWGLPGKNRRIDLQYKMDEIEGVRVELKEGVNPRRIISLKIKGLAKTESLQNPGKASNPAIQKESFSKRTEKRKLPGEKNKPSEDSNQSRSEPLYRSRVSAPPKSKLSTYTPENQGRRDAFTIPLTRVGQPISLEKIESQASELAQFLRVSLETSYLDS